MNPSRDPFGFPAKSRQQQGTGPILSRNTNQIVVVAQPGQEVRVVVADDGGPGAFQVAASASPKPSGDSSSSPKPPGDSSSSPKPGGDSGSPDAFGFRTFRPGFSPTPVTIIARSGQEIRIVIPDQSGAVRSVVQGFSGDSNSSPKPPGDQ
jgi:hypothetical protein